MKKVLNPGMVWEWGQNAKVKVPVFVNVKWDDGRLSITGVVGPRSNGDAYGSCGQIDLRGLEWVEGGEEWTSAQRERLAELWDRWHLNDMRAECEHQRATWDIEEKVEVVSYTLTTEAYQLREASIRRAAKYAVTGQTSDLNETEKALVLLEDWFKDKFNPPDADSPLSGCYGVRKRETKNVGWVYKHEHPKGLLMKTCEVCGYKYGSQWLKEEVPQAVIDELWAMPETKRTPAWV